MIKRVLFFVMTLWAFVACTDDDSFTTDASARLTFSTDTVKLYTVFSTIGSSTYTFWVYNTGSKGIRLSTVRLQQGNQTGFRVNVDGSYLDSSLGAVVTDLEVRKGDSIRVFVELTAPENKQNVAQLVTDNLLFQLESGVEQRVNLRGYAWDAYMFHDLLIKNDTVITGPKPIVVYGGIKVDTTAILRLKNIEIFFHDGAGLDVYGRLVTDSVLMRGDRLDHMFSYLPYDRVSGQWRGVRFYGSSTGNSLKRMEIRNAYDGIRCDSALLSPTSQRLYMEHSVIHNSKGYGMQVFNAYVGMLNCQITNSEADCVCVYGGAVIMQSCTLAQFYPFAVQNGERGVALRFTNAYNGKAYPLEQLQLTKSIVTGYADDEIMGEGKDEKAAFNYHFENSLLRTPEVKDSVNFVNVKWENPKDEIQGKKQFKLIDEKNLMYDFHLDSLSTAIGWGCY